MNAHLIPRPRRPDGDLPVPSWAVAEYRLDRAFADLGDAEDRIDLQARVIETLIAEREKALELVRLGMTWAELSGATSDDAFADRAHDPTRRSLGGEMRKVPRPRRRDLLRDPSLGAPPLGVAPAPKQPQPIRNPTPLRSTSR